MKYPDFLSIGAPKAGSTWLFDNLSRHPQIWLPPTKSIKYLDGTARTVRRKRVRQILRGELRNQLSCASVGWSFRYFLAPFVNTKWYAQQFLPGQGLCCGEVAPSYCGMSFDQLRRVKELMPSVKIILMLRNPIDRLWSHTMHTLVKVEKRPFDSLTDQDFLDYFLQEQQQRRTDFVRILDEWQSMFPPKNFFIGFFEEISTSPLKLLSRVCEFLDVEPNDIPFKNTVNKVSNPGTGNQPSPSIQAWLSGRYIDQLEILAQRFGEPATAWLENARQNCRTAA